MKETFIFIAGPGIQIGRLERNSLSAEPLIDDPHAAWCVVNTGPESLDHTLSQEPTSAHSEALDFVGVFSHWIFCQAQTGSQDFCERRNALAKSRGEPSVQFTQRQRY